MEIPEKCPDCGATVAVFDAEMCKVAECGRTKIGNYWSERPHFCHARQIAALRLRAEAAEERAAVAERAMELALDIEGTAERPNFSEHYVVFEETWPVDSFLAHEREHLDIWLPWCFAWAEMELRTNRDNAKFKEEWEGLRDG